MLNQLKKDKMIEIKKEIHFKKMVEGDEANFTCTKMCRKKRKDKNNRIVDFVFCYLYMYFYK